MRVPCHVHFDVIQSTRGGHLLKRRAYQECDAVTVDDEPCDWRAFREHHRGTVVLAPDGADVALAAPEEFTRALLAVERNSRAQHARTLDIALPRAAVGLELLFGAWVVAPLIAMGMTAQLDAECLPASDGGENPHCHASFAMRRLHGPTFGNKERPWNALFRRLGSRYMRSVLAARIVAAAAYLGQGVVVDPRRKSFYADAPPEPRFELARWRAHIQSGDDPEVAAVLARRRESEPESMPVMPENEIIGIRSAALAGAKPEDHLAAWQAAYDLARSSGFEFLAAGRWPGDEFTVARPGLGAALDFDASATLRLCGDELRNGDWEQVATLIQALDWPALAIEGSQDAVDALGVLLAPNGVAVVNHPMSGRALRLLACRGPAGLLADVRGYDPRGVLEAMFAARVATDARAEPLADSLGAPADIQARNQANDAAASAPVTWVIAQDPTTDNAANVDVSSADAASDPSSPNTDEAFDEGDAWTL